MSLYNTIIVGGGVAGCSTAHQLFSIKNFNKKVLLLEAGTIGEGLKEKLPTKSSLSYTHEKEPETFYPWLSGSNVFDDPSRIKMVISCLPISAQEWVAHHGKIGITLFKKLSIIGRDEQFRLANLYMNPKKLDPQSTDVNNISADLDFIQLGTLMVCKPDEVDEFFEDFLLYREAGYNVEWWDKEKVEKFHGSDFDYHSGMFFPKDGVIYSSKYAKVLAEVTKKNGLEVRENTMVSDVVEEKKDGKNIVKVVLKSGEILYSERVVMCTGGLYMDKYLGGILKPVYSYLTGMKSPVDYSKVEGKTFSTMKNTPNILTHKFLCDFSMCNGWMRISGEDHYSSSLYSRTNYRGKEMEKWIMKRYPFLRNPLEVKYINGVCSESPDYLPLLGRAFEGSNIIYNLCCNGWGQAILSAMAILVTGVLGERTLSKEEEELVDFIDIRRFRLGNLKDQKLRQPKF